MSEENWLEKFHEANRVTHNIAVRLNGLSGSFYHTGNDRMADILYECASALYRATEEMRDAVHESVDESCRRAQESSINVLNAALAGIALRETNNTL